MAWGRHLNKRRKEREPHSSTGVVVSSAQLDNTQVVREEGSNRGLFQIGLGRGVWGWTVVAELRTGQREDDAIPLVLGTEQRESELTIERAS